MTVVTYTRHTQSHGSADIHDITAQVLECARASGVQNGTATVFVPGSTAGLTTIEHEPGVVHDLRDCFDRLAPVDISYAHEQAWHDGNGHSHVRAALLGPSLVVPLEKGRPVLGTWQQIVLVDFDNKPRQRTWTITIMGE
jgi:secondary thiamine-phosphate synthase enzyme